MLLIKNLQQLHSNRKLADRYVNLFQIINIKEKQAYKLQLFNQ